MTGAVLRWTASVVSDDQGNTAAQPRRRETVFHARDGEDCEWMVAPHDDGQTWNWTRSTATGELIDLGTDFATSDAAKAAAEQRALEG